MDTKQLKHWETELLFIPQWQAERQNLIMTLFIGISALSLALLIYSPGGPGSDMAQAGGNWPLINLMSKLMLGSIVFWTFGKVAKSLWVLRQQVNDAWGDAQGLELMKALRADLDEQGDFTPLYRLLDQRYDFHALNIRSNLRSFRHRLQYLHCVEAMVTQRLKHERMTVE